MALSLTAIFTVADAIFDIPGRDPSTPMLIAGLLVIMNVVCKILNALTSIANALEKIAPPKFYKKIEPQKTFERL